MVWGTAKGRTCLPNLAARIQAPWLVWEQMPTVSLGDCTVPCMSLHAPASLPALFRLGCTLSIWDAPLALKASTQSPLPLFPHVGTLVTRRQSRTNVGAPRGRGVPSLAREGGRQP